MGKKESIYVNKAKNVAIKGKTDDWVFIDKCNIGYLKKQFQH